VSVSQNQQPQPQIRVIRANNANNYQPVRRVSEAIVLYD